MKCSAIGLLIVLYCNYRVKVMPLIKKVVLFSYENWAIIFRVILNTLKSSVDNNKKNINIQNILLITLERVKLPFFELCIWTLLSKAKKAIDVKNIIGGYVLINIILCLGWGGNEILFWILNLTNYHLFKVNISFSKLFTW